MPEESYKITDLQNLKYVKLSYTDNDNKVSEVITKIRRLDDEVISVYVRSRKFFNVTCPQKITVKFVAEDCAYISIATLQKVAKVDDLVYFTVQPPQIIYKQQNRKYFRVNLQRSCVLVATDKQEHSSVFLSKVVNVSGGGVLIHCLESLFNHKYVSIEPEAYEHFNIILFLDYDVVMNLSARFVRQEVFDDSLRYAFEFTNTKPTEVDTICKYLAKKQLEQLQAKNK